MPHVSRAALPSHSRLHTRRGPADFLDCFAVESPLAPRAAAEIVTQFPAWAKGLVVLRNLVTAPFGLATDGPPAPDKLGLFPVEHSDAQEVVAGFDDKHLDFRVSVLRDEGRILLATWVHPHNLAGRIYLTVILPFHILIARNALARVAAA